jgi:hypothetical protein
MGYLTVYCVQTYRRQGRGVERARLTSYGRSDLALQDGREAAPRVAGALVYEVEVDAGLRSAGRIRVLEQHGSLPDQDKRLATAEYAWPAA